MVCWSAAFRVLVQKRWMPVRMSSADRIQRKGLGSSLTVSMYRWMAASRSLRERWTPRRICLLVSSAKNRSIWLSQEAEVGVRWTCQCGRLASQARIAGVLCVA
jgi:hypothetical protein